MDSFIIKWGRKRIPVVLTEMGEGEYGSCDPPGTKGRRILLRKGMGARKILSTLIHEATHYALDCLDEAYVEQLETLIMAAIDCGGDIYAEEREENSVDE